MPGTPFRRLPIHHLPPVERRNLSNVRRFSTLGPRRHLWQRRKSPPQCSPPARPPACGVDALNPPRAPPAGTNSMVWMRPSTDSDNRSKRAVSLDDAPSTKARPSSRCPQIQRGLRQPDQPVARRLDGGTGTGHSLPRHRPSTFDPRPSTRDPRPSTRDLRPSTFDLRPSTFDLRPSTQDPRPSTRDPRPETHPDVDTMA